MLLTDALLLDYKRCQRRAFLNRYGDPHLQDPERDFFLKLRQESQNHHKKVLAELYPHYQQPSDSFPWKEKAQETEALMAKGVECIYKGVLFHGVQDALAKSITLVGIPNLLVKFPGQSKFGNWTYIPISIQLGRRPKPEYKTIAAFYAYLLALIQESLPPTAQLILRPLKTYNVELGIWLPKVREVVTDCLQMLHQLQEPEVFISRQRCSLCHWYTHCYTFAQSQQHLSLVPGVTPSRYESLQTLGVDSVTSLANASPVNIGELIGFDLATQLQQQAQSIVENRAIIRKRDFSLSDQAVIPTAPIELYFDIEAEPELNLDYLLGILLVDREKNTKQFYPFIAEQPEDEKLIWLSFITFVNNYPDAPIFHYSEYEVETIKRLANLYDTPQEQLENLLFRCIDIHKQVITLVTLPVESYSLKSLANWLGFHWRDPGVGGDQCVCWYDQWLTTGDRSLLEAILRYNEDDCWATFHLKNWLVEFFLNCLETKT